LYESLSAFAIRTGGGVLSFGLVVLKDLSIMSTGDAHSLPAVYLWKTTP
jgi:hypothetical protein